LLAKDNPLLTSEVINGLCKGHVGRKPNKDEAHLQAKLYLARANKPYFPQGCDKVLATRIFNAAESIELFSTIKHLTSATALESILNESLMGRKTLEQFYLSYQPAALAACDIRDGDHNVICFGPNQIDPKSIQDDSIEITLDLKKIEKNNACIFYKQKDFGFQPTGWRVVALGENDSLTFDHASPLYMPNNRGNASFQLADTRKRAIAYSTLPKFEFIAYDFTKMHQILILNFFKFLDELRDISDVKDRSNPPKKTPSHLKDVIYAKIAKLSDQELVSFLLDLGKNMTDTAEFNFYGAHRIDFSSILTIKSGTYTLNLSEFIGALQEGNLPALQEAKEHLPQLWKSYRFVDYLLSAVNNETIKIALQTDRNQCVLPAWLAESENNESKKIDTGINRPGK
jgi:hypothetical protein